MITEFQLGQRNSVVSGHGLKYWERRDAEAGGFRAWLAAAVKR